MKHLTATQKKLYDWLKSQLNNSDEGWICRYPFQQRVMQKLIDLGYVEIHKSGLSREYRLIQKD